MAAYGTAFSAVAPVLAAAGNSRPNVLLIVSDDQGWGDLPSNWKKTDVRLPVLDRIGKEGYRFPEYHTAPLCGPAEGPGRKEGSSRKCVLAEGVPASRSRIEQDNKSEKSMEFSAKLTDQLVPMEFSAKFSR